jgi:hypothetical protein
MSNQETNLLKLVMLAISNASARMFRNNVAQAWVGQVLQKTPSTITLANPRPLHAGLCKGSADLIGWQTIVITPEMVGQKIAVFTAIEVKTATGKVSADQLNFINTVHSAGGISGIVRSPDDATKILNDSPIARQRKTS